MSKNKKYTNADVANAQNDKSFKGAVLKRVAGYLLEHKPTLIICLLMMLTSNILALAAPKISQRAIDEIERGAGNIDVRQVVIYCLIMLGFYAVSAVLSYILAITMVRLSQKIVYTMRKQIFDHLTELPVGFFDVHATGEIISRISYDVDTVNASLSHDLLQICASVVTVVGALAMMISISPVMIAVFAITVPISILYTRHR